MEVVVKRYDKGPFSTYLTDMETGDYVSCKACFGRVMLKKNCFQVRKCG